MARHPITPKKAGTAGLPPRQPLRPRVTVVIPNYNYARYLSAAIESVLAQDFDEPIEIIVVDDGSTDDSLQVLQRYEDRVRIISQKNQGYSAAFNNGLSRATTEFVCLLDADDVWKPQKVRRVIELFARRPDAGIVQHYLEDTDAALNPLPMDFPPWPETFTIEDYTAGRTTFAATSGLTLRRKTAQNALPIPVSLRFLYADDYLAVHALFQGPCANLPEPLACHRVHGENFCAGSLADPAKIAADFEMRRVFRDRLDELLGEYDKELSPLYRKTEDLEMVRREVLYHMHNGERRKAWTAWRKGLPHASGGGLFRMATCAVALVSPRLYLSLYGFFAGNLTLRGLRRRLSRKSPPAL